MSALDSLNYHVWRIVALIAQTETVNHVAKCRPFIRRKLHARFHPTGLKNFASRLKKLQTKQTRPASVFIDCCFRLQARLPKSMYSFVWTFIFILSLHKNLPFKKNMIKCQWNYQLTSTLTSYGYVAPLPLFTHAQMSQTFCSSSSCTTIFSE